MTRQKYDNLVRTEHDRLMDVISYYRSRNAIGQAESARLVEMLYMGNYRQLNDAIDIAADKSEGGL